MRATALATIQHFDGAGANLRFATRAIASSARRRTIAMRPLGNRRMTLDEYFGSRNRATKTQATRSSGPGRINAWSVLLLAVRTAGGMAPEEPGQAPSASPPAARSSGTGAPRPPWVGTGFPPRGSSGPEPDELAETSAVYASAAADLASASLLPCIPTGTPPAGTGGDAPAEDHQRSARTASESRSPREPNSLQSPGD